MNKIKTAIIILAVLVFLYFVYAFFTVTTEGMETNDYAYLEPVTPENAITDATLNKVADIGMKPNPNLSESQNEAIKNSWIKRMKETILEVEGQYFITNNKWPIDRFTQKYLDYFKSLPEYRPDWTARFFSGTNREILYNLYNFKGYLKSGSKQLLDGTPEGKILNGYKTSENHNLYCPSVNSYMHQYDKDKNGKFINRQLVDIKTLPKIIPGFDFLNEPCDPCNWQKCQFSMDKQPTSDLFRNIWGLTTSSVAPSSTPSTIASQQAVNLNSFPLLGGATASPNSSSSSSTEATLSANDQKISDAKANEADANAAKAQADAVKAKAEADKAKTEAENSKKTLFQKIGF